MGINPMIGVGFVQKLRYWNQSVQRCLTTDPVSFHRYKGSQYPESGTSDRARLRAKRPFAEIWFIICLIDKIPIEIRPDRIAPFSCHATVRMRIMPKIPESLALD